MVTGVDKYEFKLKVDEMKALVSARNYNAAAEIAETINWRKIRNLNALVLAGEVFEQVGRYEDSKEILLMAYDKSPIGRNIIYRLAEIAIKTNRFDDAQEYYDEFVDIAPHDNLKYVLKYKMTAAQGLPYKEQIKILEELKEQEYSEEWAYELAFLYHKDMQPEKCVEACDELILWFGDGIYVEKALELKMHYQPLSKQQEEKYHIFRQKRTGVIEVKPNDSFESGEIIHEAVEIPAVQTNAGQYNTANLQKTIAKGLQQINTVKMQDDVYGHGQMQQPAPEMTMEEIQAEWERTKQEMNDALNEAVSPKQEASKEKSIEKAEQLMQRLLVIVPQLAGQIAQQPLSETAVQQQQPTKVQDDLEQAGRIVAGINQLLQDQIDSLQAEVGQQAEIRQQAEVRQQEMSVLPEVSDPTRELPQVPENMLEGKEIGAIEKVQMNGNSLNKDTSKKDENPVMSAWKEAQPGISAIDLLQRVRMEKTAADSMQQFQAETMTADDKQQIHTETAETVQNIYTKSANEMQQADMKTGNSGIESLRQLQAGSSALESLRQMQAENAAAAPISRMQDGLRRQTEDIMRTDQPQQMSNVPEDIRPQQMQNILSDKIQQQMPHISADKIQQQQQITNIPENMEQQRIINIPADMEQQRVSNIPTDMEQQRVSNIPADVEQQQMTNIPADVQQRQMTNIPADVQQQQVTNIPADVQQQQMFDISTDRNPEQMPDGSENMIQRDQELDIPEIQYENTFDDVSGQMQRSESMLNSETDEMDRNHMDSEAYEFKESINEEPEYPQENKFLASKPRFLTQAQLQAGAAMDGKKTTQITKEFSKEAMAAVHAENLNSVSQADSQNLEEMKRLTPEQKQIFSYFVPIAGMEAQIYDLLMGVSEHLQYDKHAQSGNIIIEGISGSGKTVLIMDIIKVLQKEIKRPVGNTGKIDANALNQKDLDVLMDKISGGCLIIESAGRISRETAVRLSRCMENDHAGTLYIIEDTEEGIQKALERDSSFAAKFTEKITIPLFSADELVEFGKAYANDLNYDIDEMGVLALYKRISAIQKLDHVTTLTEVKEIVDEAIDNAEKGVLKKVFGMLTATRANDDNYIILREKDFEES